jgi:DnaJ family protein C protein 9
MIDTDPMDQFFTEEEQAVSPSYLLYTTLGLSPSNKDEQEKISQDDIKRAYRKSAIKYHPDKQASKGEKEKEEAVREFQKVGFAYAVLSDEPRRKRSVRWTLALSLNTIEPD